MPRKFVILAAFVALLAAAEAPTSPAEAKGNLTVISGGDLPHSITLPFEDSWAFSYPYSPNITWDQFRSWPERLDATPSNPGPGYDIYSDFSGIVVSELGLTLQQTSEQKITATYYPESAAAHVMVEPDGHNLWIQLDPERAALLDRYIALGRAGLLPEEPSILDVFAAEYQLNGTFTPVAVDGRPLTSEELASFWPVVASERWPEIHVTISLAGAKPYVARNTAFDSVEAMTYGYPELTDVDNSTLFDERVEAMVYGYPEYVTLALTAPDGRRIELAYYPVTSAMAGLPMNWCCAPTDRGIAVPPDIADAFAAALGVERPAVEAGTSAASDVDSRFIEAGHRRAAAGIAALVVALGLAAALATGGTLVRSGRRGAHISR
jgi:hypothetical protein